MAPIGATSNMAPWQQNETAIAVRNNSDLSSALSAAQMLIQSPDSDVRHAAEMETQNNADMARAMTAAQAQVQNNRAKTTRDQYNKKQEEWEAWCNKRKFQDKATVTPSKLVLWLQEEIIPMGNRSKGKMEGAILSVSGLEGYIKPVIALYEVSSLRITTSLIIQMQKAMGSNQHPTPRTPALQGLVKYCETERQRLLKDAAGLDRGREVLSTFGTPKEFNNTVDAQMHLGTLVSFRTRMDLLMSKFMMLRGKDRRHCELADLFTIDAVNEAENGNARLLVLRIAEGKVPSAQIPLNANLLDKQGRKGTVWRCFQKQKGRAMSGWKPRSVFVLSISHCHGTMATIPRSKTVVPNQVAGGTRSSVRITEASIPT